MKRWQIITAVILPALMLYLAWPPRQIYVLAFIAFIPLFILEQRSRDRKGSYWLIYASLFLFNIANTWWVWYASSGGAVAMLIANTFLMTIPWLAYRKAVRSIGQGKALMAFICYWMGMEYLHLNWDISWPWLSLGNVFAMHPYAVQWYEYTGMQGGSLWILTVNALLFWWWNQRKATRALSAGLAFLLPFFISLVLNSSVATFDSGKDVQQLVVVQPNVDPYEKFNQGSEIRNFEAMLGMVEKHVDEQTDFVVFPETAIVENIDEDAPERSYSIRLLRLFLQRHPQVQILTGASTYRFFGPDEKPSATARTLDDGRTYDFYNSSMVLQADSAPRFYHKSKLVPGVEQMPYPALFGFLEYWSIDMGGISGSLGKSDGPLVFGSEPARVAPLVCYESIFPGFVSGFVRQGAGLIVVMTNDGWWKDTDGYKQHLHYARLRAIEHRRDVIRSANTGISCHIDKKGSLAVHSQWWQSDVLKVEAQASDKLTFFAAHGNYLGRVFSFLAVFLWLGVFVKRRVKHGT